MMGIEPMHAATDVTRDHLAIVAECLRQEIEEQEAKLRKEGHGFSYGKRPRLLAHLRADLAKVEERIAMCGRSA